MIRIFIPSCPWKMRICFSCCRARGIDSCVSGGETKVMRTSSIVILLAVAKLIFTMGTATLHSRMSKSVETAGGTGAEFICMSYLFVCIYFVMCGLSDVYANESCHRCMELTGKTTSVWSGGGST